jgi:dCMP deaminase
MDIADAVSVRSKDPRTKVGAVLVNKDNHIIATGYNGFPPGMTETDELWQAPIKYTYVCHAEANAIANKTQSSKGSVIYTTLFPCNECSKLIASAGITHVYYREDKKNGLENDVILRACGIIVSKIS